MDRRPVKGPKFIVDVYSHNFAVTGFGERGKRDLEAYCAAFEEWQFVKRWSGTKRELVRRYVAVTADEEEYRFHINAAAHFKNGMASFGYHDSDFQYIKHPLYEAAEIEFDINPAYTERDHQVSQIKHLLEPGRTKLIELRMGGGKSFISMKALSIVGQRFALIVKTAFLERWIKDFIGPKSVLRLEPDELIVVKSTRNLQDVIALGLAGELDCKVLAFTNGALANMYRHYSVFNRDTKFYGCAPVDLWKTLKVGPVLTDEVHIDFFNNFRQDLYSHMHKRMSLSATLLSKQAFQRKMHNLMFPTASRTSPGTQENYTAVKSLHYTLIDPEDAKISNRGQSMYSHSAFEEWIMKDKDRFQRYLKMIGEVVEYDFVKIRKPHQKMLIIVSRVEMCEALRAYLAPKYRDMKVSKFNDGDPYEDLMNSHLTISTYGKSGTAVDIKDLICVFMTVAYDAPHANLQIMGRLRKPDDYPATIPVFLVLVCTSIDKHNDYEAGRIELLKSWSISQQTILLEKPCIRRDNLKIDVKALFDLAELYPDSAEAEAFLMAYELEDDAQTQKTGKALLAHLLADGIIDEDEAAAIREPEHANPADDLVETPDDDVEADEPPLQP